jgi:hypothetical protein
VPKTETALKQKIMAANPTISRKEIRKISGKCVIPIDRETELPLTIPVVKADELRQEIDRLAPTPQILVVIVLAVYASQSAFALSQSQMALTQLTKKYGETAMPYKFMAVEMSESRDLPKKIGGGSLPSPPSCLMFYHGAEVYRKKMAGCCERIRSMDLARPRVLLLEPTASQQLVSEAALKRCGVPFDLALSPSHAIQLAGNKYGAVLAASELGPQLPAVFDAHRGAIHYLIHPADRPVPDIQDKSGRSGSVKYVFNRPLRKTAVEAELNSCKELAPSFAHSGTNTEEFMAEIESAYLRAK